MRRFLLPIAGVLVAAACGASAPAASDQGWAPIEHNLWRNGAGDIGLREWVATEQEARVSYLTVLGHSGVPLKDALDLASFKHLGAGFYADKDRLYHHYEMAGGGEFRPFANADLATFEVLSDCYARDASSVFTARGTALVDVDPQSFRTHEHAGCFAKDRRGYFFWGDRFELDASSSSHERKAVAVLDQL